MASGDMTASRTRLVQPTDGQRREWPKARADHWLSLAAAPVFAVMALLAGIQEDGMAGMLCSAAPASPLSGMVPMYVLMSAFHLAPWLRLIAIWKARRSERGLHRWMRLRRDPS